MQLTPGSTLDSELIALVDRATVRTTLDHHRTVEVRAELVAHLSDLKANAERAGLTGTAAISEVRRRFGDPEAVRRALLAGRLFRHLRRAASIPVWLVAVVAIDVAIAASAYAIERAASFATTGAWLYHILCACAQIWACYAGVLLIARLGYGVWSSQSPRLALEPVRLLGLSMLAASASLWVLLPPGAASMQLTGFLAARTAWWSPSWEMAFWTSATVAAGMALMLLIRPVPPQESPAN